MACPFGHATASPISMSCAEIFQGFTPRVSQDLDKALESRWNHDSVQTLLRPIIANSSGWMEIHLGQAIHNGTRTTPRQLEFARSVLKSLISQNRNMEGESFNARYINYLLNVDRFAMAISFLNRTPGISVENLSNNAYFNAKVFTKLNSSYIDLFPKIILIAVPQESLSVEMFARAVGLPVIFAGLTEKAESADGQVLPQYAFTTHDKYTHAYAMFDFWIEEIKSGRFESTLRQQVRFNRAFYLRLGKVWDREIEKVVMTFMFNYFRDSFSPLNLKNLKAFVATLPKTTPANMPALSIWAEMTREYFPGSDDLNETHVSRAFQWLRTEGTRILENE